MQPYFLPYIGYFQLLAAADCFVLLDDVNYINRGWINRNRVPGPGGKLWLTVPLSGASQNRLIRDIEILPDNGWKRSLTSTVSSIYANAPQVGAVLPLFEGWMRRASGNLSTFLHLCLAETAAYLGIKTQLKPTSTIYPKDERKGSERILDICRLEAATTYINLPGGRALYDPSMFASAGVELRFLEPDVGSMHLEYGGTEGPTLSMLDLMMHNPRDALQKALRKYQLTPA
jgi:hypothetical protein